jgi:hypothetical protein
MYKIWLFNKPIDLLILGFPVWLTWMACFLLPDSFIQAEVTLWVWVVFVIGIDVSHVWSTIFRTYLDKEEFHNHKNLLIYTPIISLVLFFLVATISTGLFWSILAYIALYHFIKQQYGFMQLYRVRYGFVKVKKRISDKVIIYLGMLYPVWYWHLNSDRQFSWFVSGDFINLKSVLEIIPFWQTEFLGTLNFAFNSLYFCFLIFWFIEEIIIHRKQKMKAPIGKWIWIVTTWGNWYLGIVFFNSDLVFTITNIIAHGVPYMALIFFYVEKKKAISNPSIPYSKHFYRIAFMLLTVLFLAFGEEYLWDMTLYNENKDFFSSILSYPIEIIKETIIQALILSLLSLPQITHYVLDGFIWKSNKHNPYIKTILLQ